MHNRIVIPTMLAVISLLLAAWLARAWIRSDTGESLDSRNGSFSQRGDPPLAQGEREHATMPTLLGTGGEFADLAVPDAASTKLRIALDSDHSTPRGLLADVVAVSETDGETVSIGSAPIGELVPIGKVLVGPWTLGASLTLDDTLWCGAARLVKAGTTHIRLEPSHATVVEVMDSGGRPMSDSEFILRNNGLAMMSSVLDGDGRAELLIQGDGEAHTLEVFDVNYGLAAFSLGASTPGHVIKLTCSSTRSEARRVPVDGREQASPELQLLWTFRSSGLVAAWARVVTETDLRLPRALPKDCSLAVRSVGAPPLRFTPGSDLPDRLTFVDGPATVRVDVRTVGGTALGKYATAVAYTIPSPSGDDGRNSAEWEGWVSPGGVMALPVALLPCHVVVNSHGYMTGHGRVDSAEGPTTTIVVRPERPLRVVIDPAPEDGSTLELRARLPLTPRASAWATLHELEAAVLGGMCTVMEFPQDAVVEGRVSYAAGGKPSTWEPLQPRGDGTAVLVVPPRPVGRIEIVDEDGSPPPCAILVSLIDHASGGGSTRWVQRGVVEIAHEEVWDELVVVWPPSELAFRRTVDMTGDYTDRWTVPALSSVERVRIRVCDAYSDEPVADARVGIRNGPSSWRLAADAQGVVAFWRAPSLPLHVAAQAPEYASAQFSTPIGDVPDTDIRLRPLSEIVLDWGAPGLTAPLELSLLTDGRIERSQSDSSPTTLRVNLDTPTGVWGRAGQMALVPHAVLDRGRVRLALVRQSGLVIQPTSPDMPALRYGWLSYAGLPLRRGGSPDSWSDDRSRVLPTAHRLPSGGLRFEEVPHCPVRVTVVTSSGRQITIELSAAQIAEGRTDVDTY